MGKMRAYPLKVMQLSLMLHTFSAKIRLMWLTRKVSSQQRRMILSQRMADHQVLRFKELLALQRQAQNRAEELQASKQYREQLSPQYPLQELPPELRL